MFGRWVIKFFFIIIICFICKKKMNWSNIMNISCIFKRWSVANTPCVSLDVLSENVLKYCVPINLLLNVWKSLMSSSEHHSTAQVHFNSDECFTWLNTWCNSPDEGLIIDYSFARHRGSSFLLGEGRVPTDQDYVLFQTQKIFYMIHTALFGI